MFESPLSRSKISRLDIIQLPDDNVLNKKNVQKYLAIPLQKYASYREKTEY